MKYIIWLSQWPTFKLFGITYLIGKYSLNFYFIVLWLSKSWMNSFCWMLPQDGPTYIHTDTNSGVFFLTPALKKGGEMNVHFEKISLEVSSFYLNFGIFGTKILGIVFFRMVFRGIHHHQTTPTVWKKKNIGMFPSASKSSKSKMNSSTWSESTCFLVHSGYQLM